MKQRGSLLKDMSILLFFSALVRAFFAFTCLNFFASAMNLRLFDGAHIWLYRGAVIAAILGGVLELVAGFMGALYCEEPLLAHRCIAWGAAALILGLAANVMQIIVGYGASAYVWLSGVARTGSVHSRRDKAQTNGKTVKTAMGISHSCFL